MLLPGQDSKVQEARAGVGQQGPGSPSSSRAAGIEEKLHMRTLQCLYQQHSQPKQRTTIATKAMLETSETGVRPVPSRSETQSGERLNEKIGDAPRIAGQITLAPPRGSGG